MRSRRRPAEARRRAGFACQMAIGGECRCRNARHRHGARRERYARCDQRQAARSREPGTAVRGRWSAQRYRECRPQHDCSAISSALRHRRRSPRGSRAQRGFSGTLLGRGVEMNRVGDKLASPELARRHDFALPVDGVNLKDLFLQIDPNPRDSCEIPIRLAYGRLPSDGLMTTTSWRDDAGAVHPITVKPIHNRRHS